MAVLRDERERRRDLPRREPAELLGSVGDELAEEAQHGAGIVDLEEHRAAVDRLDRMQPELERRDDAEVPATTAKRPEEIGVLVRARHDCAPSAVTTSAEIRLSHESPKPRAR